MSESATHFHADKGWRYLRVGEIIQAGDITPNGYGGYDSVSPRLIGRDVLGNRHGPADVILRAHKRKQPASTKTLTFT